MAKRRYTRKRPYKYSFKQMKYWKNKSKQEKAKRKWALLIEQLQRKIKKEIEEKQEKDERKEYIKVWLKNQGYEMKKDLYNQIRIEQIRKQATKAKQRMQRISKKGRPIQNYLKKEHIARITTQYSKLAGKTKEAYSRLLDNAMTNPKRFKETIIEQMDKLKHLLEVETTIISWNNKKVGEQAKMTIRNHTLEEIIQNMQELGIRPNEILDSPKFQELRNRLGKDTPASYRNATGTIINIEFKISLRRGTK